jgi:Uma2 family endonuclease
MSQIRYELRSDPSCGSTAAGPAEPRWEDDPFRYGYRWGEKPGEMIPLTFEDLLDPQEGDVVPDDNLNHRLALYFNHFLEHQFAGEEDVMTGGDLKLRFGEKGKGPAPDAFVLKGVRDRDRRRGSFWIGREPGRLVLAVEIVSKNYKDKDYVDSKAIYEREKVPEYVLIELQGEYLDGPYKLTCYRLDESGVYRQVEADENGGIVSEQANLRIEPDAEGWGLRVTDLRTGERLLRPGEEAEARREAEARAQEAEARAQDEAALRRALEEELARLRNER